MSFVPEQDAAEAFEMLVGLITRAFNESEFEMFLKYKMNITLYEIVEKGTFEKEVFDLFSALQRRKTINVFLRAIAKARPVPEMRRAILQYDPKALETPAPAQDQAENVGNTLRDLINIANEDPTVRNIITDSRDKLDQFNKKIDELHHYKVLHDKLHEIQITHYPILADKVKNFGTDPLAPTELRNNILELRDIYDDVHEAAGKLPDRKAKREMPWVGKLHAAIDELSDAVDRTEVDSAGHAVRLIRRQIHDEPARINGLLTDAAQELPLDELAQTIDKVIRTFPPGSPSTSEWQKAVRSLQEGQPQLRGRVAEHREWQGVEREFWEAEDRIEWGLGSIEYFKEVWTDIEPQLVSLAGAEPEAPWAKQLRDQTAQLDKDLVGQVNLVVREFKNLRRAALRRFFQLDKELLSQCDAILRIRDPVQLLSTVTHVG
jgi:hypothetical protein